MMQKYIIKIKNNWNLILINFQLLKKLKKMIKELSVYKNNIKLARKEDMGILNLYDIIKKYGKNCMNEYHLSDLYGYRLAVDISIFLYKYIRTAGEEKWRDTFIMFLCNLKKYGIKPVCIFDGPEPPIEKRDEQLSRRENSQKIVDRKNNCVQARDLILSKYCLIDIDEVPEEFIENCKNLIRPRRGYPDVTNYSDIQDICNSLNTTIERLEKQTIQISAKYGIQAFEIVELLGLTAIKAKGEAEALCSYMVVKGMVDGVLTEDTDVLVYGTERMFAFKDFKLHEGKLIGVYLPCLLEELEINLAEFQDLCIMLSCDYNQRVKGLGVVTAYELIRKYRSLEEIEKNTNYDLTPLKYKRCRELFSVPEKIDFVIPYHTQPNYEKLNKFIQDNNILIKISYIEKCFTPIAIDFSSDED